MLRDLHTGKDNSTFDVARVSWTITTVALLAGAGWNASHAGLVDLVALGQAVATNIAAHGAALWAKRDTEPLP